MEFRLTGRDNLGGTASDSMTVTVEDDLGPFRVTSPSGGEVWAPGSGHTITWNVAGTTGAPVSCPNVDIFLSTDGGESLTHTLAANTANDGSESVTLPSDATANGAILVSCANNVFFDASRIIMCTKLFEDDHEGANTWTEGFSGNENHWQRKTDGGGFGGSSNYWFVQDIGSASESFLRSETITATVNDPFISFIHKFDFEYDGAAYDGGVVDININDGGWSIIDLSHFLKNGYNTVIADGDFGSSLRNLPAYGGSSVGYVESIINLSSLVSTGQSFQIQFRQVTDASESGVGWTVDNILICSFKTPLNNSIYLPLVVK